MKYIFVYLVTLFFAINLFGQEKKSVEILKIGSPVVIDGILDEDVYSQVLPAKDFVQLQPYNGKPSFQPSEVYFFYDQSAIYVGAMLYDSAPDSIFNILTERDNIGMSDYFGVYLDPYNQGQLAYGFFITPAGVQIDIKAVKGTYDSEDGNWNAVWESKTQIVENGWTVEMMIPFSALRFSDKATSSWGLNMFRNIRRYNSNNSWNLIDRNIEGFIHQEGELTGIKDVAPPVNLSLSPYVATYFEPNNKNSSPAFLYKGGLDLKYGINEAFTLDMMLIPDFGQIQSDDKQLNLSPYELYYDEKRQFFTEGTEMFQRANIFYSRRIGASPKFSASNSLGNNEIVDYNPNETQLVNATKISGRTSAGWGLGMLNAMSVSSVAKVKDTITGTERPVTVQPFTNYNVSVIDKSLKNNSYISIINTNVAMYDNTFLANVTASDFQFQNKAKTYAIKGQAGVSHRVDNGNENGFNSKLGFETTKGKLRFGVTQNIYSDKFNPNDLGYLQRNNTLVTGCWMYYQQIEPFWIIREYNGNIWWDYIRMYKPNTLFGNDVGFNLNVTLKNNYYIYLNGGLELEKFDYYEPRVKGRFYYKPLIYWYNLNLNTDSRKLLSFYFHFGRGEQPLNKTYANFRDISANIRLGQRLQFNFMTSYNNTINELAYTDKNANEDSVYFANRDVHIFENRATASYGISNRATLSLRGRHYWSGNKNKTFFLLQPNGTLQNNTAYSKNNDQNYNAFTIDLIFRWIFAPGSELTLAWKSTAFANKDIVIYNYWNNFSDSWAEQLNSISLKVLYYIDYNKLKTKK